MKKTRTKKKKRNWLINILLLLLLLVGLALIFNNQIKYFLVDRSKDQYAIAKVTPEDIAKNQNEDANFDFASVQSVSTEAVLRAQLNNQNLPVIGFIAMPELGINLPIFKGVDNVALFTGAGTMKAEQEMGKGNYALASHRMYEPNLLFSPLERAQNGQTIYLTDLTNVYTYKVTEILTVAPTEVQLIDDVEDKTLVTMVTCSDMNATNRIIVQGEMTEKTPVKDSTTDMDNAFSAQLNRYQY